MMTNRRGATRVIALVLIGTLLASSMFTLLYYLFA
jgi:hypothetical protein